MKLTIDRLLTVLLFSWFFLWDAGFSQTIDRFREIYPIPRIGQYQQTVVSIGSTLTLFPTTSFDPTRIQMMADDVEIYLYERYGQNCTVNVAATGTMVVHILKPGEVTGSLAAQLFTSPFTPSSFPDGLRGQQSYILRSFLTGTTPAVYVVSESEQGVYYALMGLTQLIRWENNTFTFRGGDVIDWPGFEARLTGEPNPNETGTISLQQANFRYKTGLLRITHGFGDYYDVGASSQGQYATDRWLRLGGGYWWRPTFEPPLAAYNWSDSQNVTRYVSYVDALTDGVYVWHDVTDAGRWNYYLDYFWANRDAVDLAAYPNDLTPAQADADRFSSMLSAIDGMNSECDIFLTLPCYYDSPDDNTLNRVDLFHDYLTTVGQSIPASMRDRVYFILEDRSVSNVAAYQNYLDNKICHFIYSTCWYGDMWELTYTEIKDYDGTIESIFYNAWYELAYAVSAQYMWNPDLPVDENWIKTELAPRAGWLIYGEAWSPMVQFTLLNLNDQKMAREMELADLQVYAQQITQAEQYLNEALSLVPVRQEYARYLITRNQEHVSKMRSSVEENLTIAQQEFSLADAVMSSDTVGTGNLHAAILGTGRWSSGTTSLPHWVEIDLPQQYHILQMSVYLPTEGGYGWVDAEVQEYIAGAWQTIKRFSGSDSVICRFSDLRTDKIRVVLNEPGDWSKIPRNDMQLVGLRLYGEPEVTGTVLMKDTFDGTSLDTAKWTVSSWSASTTLQGSAAVLAGDGTKWAHATIVTTTGADFLADDAEVTYYCSIDGIDGYYAYGYFEVVGAVRLSWARDSSSMSLSVRGMTVWTGTADVVDFSNIHIAITMTPTTFAVSMSGATTTSGVLSGLHGLTAAGYTGGGKFRIQFQDHLGNADYRLKVADVQIRSLNGTQAPVFTPENQYIFGPTLVTITGPDAGSMIYYTTNGDMPTSNDTPYASPVSVTVNDGTRLRAIAVVGNCAPSSVTGLTFEIPVYQTLFEDSFDTIPLDIDKWSVFVWEMTASVQDSAVLFSSNGVQWANANITTNVGADFFADDTQVVYSVNFDSIDGYYVSGYCEVVDAVRLSWSREAGSWSLTAGGTTVWEGTADFSNNPISITLTPTSYAVSLKNATTTSGTLSGPHGLTAAGYTGEGKFRIRFMDHLGNTNYHLTVDDVKIRKIHKNPLPGDANFDGLVDVGDLGILAANYGTEIGATWNQGDFNRDGRVDVGDLGILAANYGTGTSGANFAADYASVFDDLAKENELDEIEEQTLCSGLGLPLIFGVFFLGFKLVSFRK